MPNPALPGGLRKRLGFVPGPSLPWVNIRGMPTEVTVEHSSGHEILDEAAVRTVQKRWRFVPATRNGQPIEGWALVPVNFVLQ